MSRWAEESPWREDGGAGIAVRSRAGYLFGVQDREGEGAQLVDRQPMTGRQVSLLRS
jgi:hypothetical protein